MLGTGGVALAQTGPQVTLKSFDGFTQLRGELVDFDGQTYTLRTRLGTLQIDALQVTCEGQGCPEVVLFGAEFAALGAEAMARDLMPNLIQGYADTLDASLEREVGAGADRRMLRIIHSNGQEMAAIDVGTAAMTDAFSGLAEGEAEIVMSAQPMTESEADQLTGAGLDDPRTAGGERIVAMDGVVALVHPDNPLLSISLEELAEVFAGEITNWSALGGPNMAITLYAPPAGSTTMGSFNELAMGPLGLDMADTVQRVSDEANVSDTVAGDPAGIGLSAFAYRRASKPLAISQACGIVSIPNAFSIKTEEYPLARRLYLYSAGNETLPGHARRLLQFATSEEAVPYVEDAGFVSVSPSAQGLDAQGRRLAYAITAQEEFSIDLMREMLTELSDAVRLSTTFRFTPGSSQLTAKSQREAEALAREIAAGSFDGQEILLVGFTDSIGQFELNRALAERRAQGVLFTMAEAVNTQAGANTSLGGATISVRGYGEMTPVGCNTSFQGRVANRRVEVWVR